MFDFSRVCLSTQGDFAPPGDIFGCPNLGDATGIWWVGTQDAATEDSPP